MKKKDIIELINAEMKWCEKNKNSVTTDFANGFIAGLMQAKSFLEIESYESIK